MIFTLNNYSPLCKSQDCALICYQYDKHWVNPKETPLTWLGLAYSMMTLALQSHQQLHEEPPELKGKTRELAVQYRHLTAQCLILEDYTYPSSHTLETIILHLQAESSRSRDCESSIIIIVGILVRLAIRMGYHRDSKPYPNITPFQGEMRRRVWAYVRAADILFSYQAGHPSIVRPCNTNTELPSNLYDDELDEDMKEVSPSRPVSETTPISFMIARGHLINSIGRIDEHSLSLKMASYDEVMKLDENLREAHAAMPLYFQARMSQESLSDPPQLCLQRIILDLLYLKGDCILHRKFLGRARDNPRCNYSRQTCIDASLKIVQHQVTLHLESQPGKKFSRICWYNSSLNGNDFLIAAMIICLDLYNTVEAERRGKASTDDLYAWSLERRASMFAALENAVAIWASLRDVSIEAWKAHTAISVMLCKIKAYDTQQQRQVQQPSGDEVDDMVPEKSAAMTLEMLSSGGMANNYTSNNAYNFRPDQAMKDESTVISSYLGEQNAQQQLQSDALSQTVRAQCQFMEQQAVHPQLQTLPLPGFGMNGIETGLGSEFDWVSCCLYSRLRLYQYL